jgi:hypothetical protein
MEEPTTGVPEPQPEPASKKVGRPRLGKEAMTVNERVAKFRAGESAKKTAPRRSLMLLVVIPPGTYQGSARRFSRSPLEVHAGR